MLSTLELLCKIGPPVFVIFSPPQVKMRSASPRLQLVPIFGKQSMTTTVPLERRIGKLRSIVQSRGGVEDTRLEAKDTKKIRGQGQPFRGQNLSRPRTGMLEAKDTAASVLQKKGLQKFFSGDLQFIGLPRIFDWGRPNH